ncbi:MAG TPA: hypothetical protein ENN85_00575 [Methanoculleus sp.]|nr:hypothetical protein [Methanoculleus sp.]
MTAVPHEQPLISGTAGICCPQCGSSEVFYESGLYGGRMYRCKQCGYRGALVIAWDGGAARPDPAPAPGATDGTETPVSRVPLWVKALALLFLLYLLFIRL